MICCIIYNILVPYVPTRFALFFPLEKLLRPICILGWGSTTDTGGKRGKYSWLECLDGNIWDKNRVKAVVMCLRGKNRITAMLAWRQSQALELLEQSAPFHNVCKPQYRIWRPRPVYGAFAAHTTSYRALSRSQRFIIHYLRGLRKDTECSGLKNSPRSIFRSCSPPLTSNICCTVGTPVAVGFVPIL